MRKLVSVVVPVYNNGKHISRCIDSILAQDYRAFELIIVDDGSTDNTKKIVKKYRDDRVRYIYQDNRGVSTARNKGVSVSIGDYIMFADSDDEFAGDAIKKAVLSIEDSGADAVRFSYTEKYSNTNKDIDLGALARKTIKMNNYDNMRLIVDSFFGEKAKNKCLVMTLLIKKEILVKHKITFDSNLFMMEDVVFYADLFNTGASIYFLNEPLYIYYQNANSVSHDSGKLERTIRGVLMANREIIERFPEEQITINNKHFQIIMSLLTQNYLANHKVIRVRGLQKLARKTCFDGNIVNKALRYSVIESKKGLFASIIKIKALKNRICVKEKML